MSECVSVALKYLDNPHVEALKLGKSDSQVTSNRSFTNWSCDEIMFFDDERIKQCQTALTFLEENKIILSSSDRLQSFQKFVDWRSHDISVWQRVDTFIQVNNGEDDVRDVIEKYCIEDLKELYKAKANKNYVVLSEVIINFLTQIDLYETNNSEENFNDLERIQGQIDTVKSAINYTIQELENSFGSIELIKFSQQIVQRCSYQHLKKLFSELQSEVITTIVLKNDLNQRIYESAFTFNNRYSELKSEQTIQSINFTLFGPQNQNFPLILSFVIGQNGSIMI